MDDRICTHSDQDGWDGICGDSVEEDGTVYACQYPNPPKAVGRIVTTEEF